MEYIAPIYKSAADAKNFPVAAIDSYEWDENGFRPESYGAVFAVENEGIHAVLWSFEENVRCECKRRDDAVYTDSCLEFFIMPFENDKRYLNFEVNPNGVYLSQIGACRSDRVFIKELTKTEPAVYPIKIEEGGKLAWGYELIIPEKLISELYKTDYSVSETEMRANFYKCGDMTDRPHYGSHFPVRTDSPDFHRPEFFGTIIFRKA